jgi:dipeptidase E
MLFRQEFAGILGNTRRTLFIPYALADHDLYLRIMQERGLGEGLESIHRCADPARAVAEANAVFVGGGNTFRLLSELYRLELLEPVRQRVRAGMPYVGVSAGTNVACPTIKTTNDMPITMPPSMEALELVPFQVNPHYFPGPTFYRLDDRYQEHFGETRDDRLREFHEVNDTPVIGLWEGGMLRIEDDELTLIGARARIFVKGQEPRDVEAGSGLLEMLNL